MKFTVNNKTYFVKWEHLKDIKNTPVITICKIYDNTTSFNEPLFEEQATCSIDDFPNKNTGRKISLKRALNKLFPYSYHIRVINEQIVIVPDEINVTHQEYRAIAWKEYFNESPKRFK